MSGVDPSVRRVVDVAEERYFVTVDIRSKQGAMADAEQFRKRHADAAMATLQDGSGISFYLPVFTETELDARKRVLVWAQECFAAPRYQVSIRKVEAAPIKPPPTNP